MYNYVCICIYTPGLHAQLAPPSDLGLIDWYIYTKHNVSIL